MATKTAVSSDLEQLTELNLGYLRSVEHSDVRWFEKTLAEDFQCSNPDGSIVDRASFLKQTALPFAGSNIQAHDVNIRLMGDFAIIHARTTFTLPDGRTGGGRYTDVWARRQDGWRVVSAQVTRIAPR